MKGFIKQTVAGCLSASLVSLVGCSCYRDLVDPCWPQRYNMQASASINEMHGAQAEKGHILDQTVWNWYFVTDPKTGVSDVLNGAGIEALKTISSRQPIPDFQIYLQNAQDVPYNPAIAPDKLVGQRNQLNDRRIRAIQNFLATQAPLHGGGAYQVAVHDFAPPGIRAEYTDDARIGDQKYYKAGGLVPFVQPKIN